MGAAVAQPWSQAGKHLSPRITFGVLDGKNVFNDVVTRVHVPAAASLLMMELCVPVPLSTQQSTQCSQSASVPGGD